MASLCAHGNGIAGSSTPDDLQRKVRLMAVNPDEHATIYFVMPDGQIRVVGVDFDLGIDLRILRPIIGHGDKHCFLPRLDALFKRLVEMPNGGSFLRSLVIPCPQ